MPIEIPLRDYFAGQALAGMFCDDVPFKHLAEMSYEMADAMLSARAAREGGEETGQPLAKERELELLRLAEDFKRERDALIKAGHLHLTYEERYLLIQMMNSFRAYRAWGPQVEILQRILDAPAQTPSNSAQTFVLTDEEREALRDALVALEFDGKHAAITVIERILDAPAQTPSNSAQTFVLTDEEREALEELLSRGNPYDEGSWGYKQYRAIRRILDAPRMTCGECRFWMGDGGCACYRMDNGPDFYCADWEGKS